MRIGTWNLDGKWSDGHRALLLDGNCDIWLLTEVAHKAFDAQSRIAGFDSHHSEGEMVPGRFWAAVLSHERATTRRDPHPASAAAEVDGVTFCSSVLPWRTCGDGPPWTGDTFDGKAKNAIDCLMNELPRSNLVWGGDWNQSLVGTEYVGSYVGREYLQTALNSRRLKALTGDLLSKVENGCHSIDHVAVPSDWAVIGEPLRILAEKLSDHDAYVVEVDYLRK